MYMYYLLGYRILGQCDQRMKSLMKLIEDSPDKRNYRRHFDQNEDLHVYYKDVLGPRLLLEVKKQLTTFTIRMFSILGGEHVHLIRGWRCRFWTGCGSDVNGSNEER